MKKFTLLNLILAVTLILGSCGSSNSVVSNRIISKRKYNKRFHINTKGNYKSNGEDVAKKEDSKKEDVSNTIASIYSEGSTSSVEANDGGSLVSNESGANRVELNSEFTDATADEIPLVIEADKNDDLGMVSQKESKSKMPKLKDVRKQLKAKGKSSQAGEPRSGGGSSLMNILLIILIIIAIVLLLKLLGGVLGALLSILLFILIVYLILKILGII